MNKSGIERASQPRRGRARRLLAAALGAVLAACPDINTSAIRYVARGVDGFVLQDSGGSDTQALPDTSLPDSGAIDSNGRPDRPILVTDSAGFDGARPDAATGRDSGSACIPSNFSFFVVSLQKIQEWGGDEGLGGNLGGLAGADAKCQEAAEAVGSCKTWRAFLSVTDDGTGNPVHAIDRIGSGPWYDVNGYLVAENVAGLLQTRPAGDTDVIWYDDWNRGWPFNQCLTTELGNCNHSYGDSHDTLTGSNRQGRLYSTDSRYTCNDWTSSDVNVQLPIGHSWPRQLNSTRDDDANWIYAHSNCTSGPGGGGTCNGCGRNINLLDTMEPGVGGDGGYGSWYCFAL
ncbi:MAG: hypothetical protein JXR83_12215 [Deltaproteobacteria bacterium]|nr:hypothetical protein [Deltaproteobacteria bacterium]